MSYTRVAEPAQLPQLQAASAPTPRIITADYAVDAFGGKLFGIHHGEWAGELLFQDEAGGIEIVLHEEVRGIVRNHAGVFAFTGMSH